MLFARKDEKNQKLAAMSMKIFDVILLSQVWLHCKWKKMDDMKVMFVFKRVMLADEGYVPDNESYHYKMAFGLCAWKQT